MGAFRDYQGKALMWPGPNFATLICRLFGKYRYGPEQLATNSAFMGMDVAYVSQSLFDRGIFQEAAKRGLGSVGGWLARGNQRKFARS